MGDCNFDRLVLLESIHIFVSKNLLDITLIPLQEYREGGVYVGLLYWYFLSKGSLLMGKKY